MTGTPALAASFSPSVLNSAGMKAPLRVDWGKMRTEMETGAGRAITIVRRDLGVTWVLMTENKTYMEMPIKEKDVASRLTDPDVKMDKKFIKNDTVDGHPAKNYKVTIHTSGQRETTGYIWEATDLDNMVVKFQDEDRKMTTTWRNIKRSGVSDASFELPDGYSKMTMPAMPMMGR